MSAARFIESIPSEIINSHVCCTHSDTIFKCLSGCISAPSVEHIFGDVKALGTVASSFARSEPVRFLLEDDV